MGQDRLEQLKRAVDDYSQEISTEWVAATFDSDAGPVRSELRVVWPDGGSARDGVTLTIAPDGQSARLEVALAGVGLRERSVDCDLSAWRLDDEEFDDVEEATVRVVELLEEARNWALNQRFGGE